MITRLQCSAMMLTGALWLIALGATAQDAAVVNATTVHVTLDNEHVRVLDSVLKPGQQEKLHSHPACVIHVLSGGTARNHLADGKVVDVKLKAGDTLYRDPMTHWAENTGRTTLHLLIVELKAAS